MSKKPFVQFANHIRALVEQGKTTEAKACYDMVLVCHDNPRFDRGTFYDACGFPATLARAA